MWHSPYRPTYCRELLRELNPAPFMGPARVRMKRNGKVEVQLRGRGNDRWKPRAILIIYDAAGGGSELRIGLERNWEVKVFWVLWWLVWIWIALQGIEHVAAAPFSFIEGLVVAVIFSQCPALLTSLVWDREPAKLVDLISQQLGAGDTGVPGGWQPGR